MVLQLLYLLVKLNVFYDTADIKVQKISKECYFRKFNILAEDGFFAKNNAYTFGIPNHFPLANSFAKGKMLSAGRPPTGPKWGISTFTSHACTRH